MKSPRLHNSFFKFFCYTISMEISALDIGSYSIKLVECSTDKKKVYSQKMKEVVIDQYHHDVYESTGEDLSEQEVRDRVIKELTKEIKKDSKIISVVPNEFLTTRFLSLPVKNKKKAEQMIPFQLEEDLPFSLTSSHIAYYLETTASGTYAQVSIAGLASFENLYAGITQVIRPDFLSSEMSLFYNFVRVNKLAGPFCILDLGHNTSKAYFFYNQNLVTVQTSYIAGRVINEAIADNYQIGTDEAVLFKHQNAFLLSDTQFNDVDENQREFAKMMNHIFAPLITDLKRWELGYRLQTKAQIQQIYICGGTSNLRNVANYLSQQLSTKVSHLNLFDIVAYKDSDNDQKMQMKYAIPHLMAWSVLHKNKLVNFLTGNFAKGDKENLPLHSSAYIGIRVFLVTIIIMLSLFGEKYFLYKNIQDLDKKVTAIMKNPTLEFMPKDQRDFKKKPELTLSLLKSKDRLITQEIHSIESASRVNSISPLIMLSQTLKNNPDLSLTNFTVSEGQVTAIFEAKNVDLLDAVNKTLSSANLNGYKANLNPNSKILMVNFIE